MAKREIQELPLIWMIFQNLYILQINHSRQREFPFHAFNKETPYKKPSLTHFCCCFMIFAPVLLCSPAVRGWSCPVWRWCVGAPGASGGLCPVCWQREAAGWLLFPGMKMLPGPLWKLYMEVKVYQCLPVSLFPAKDYTDTAGLLQRFFFTQGSWEKFKMGMKASVINTDASVFKPPVISALWLFFLVKSCPDTDPLHLSVLQQKWV